MADALQNMTSDETQRIRQWAVEQAFKAMPGVTCVEVINHADQIVAFVVSGTVPPIPTTTTIA